MGLLVLPGTCLELPQCTEWCSALGWPGTGLELEHVEPYGVGLEHGNLARSRVEPCGVGLEHGSLARSRVVPCGVVLEQRSHCQSHVGQHSSHSRNRSHSHNRSCPQSPVGRSRDSRGSHGTDVARYSRVVEQRDAGRRDRRGGNEVLWLLAQSPERLGFPQLQVRSPKRRRSPQ